jgi:formyl-CoA transferase
VTIAESIVQTRVERRHAPAQRRDREPIETQVREFNEAGVPCGAIDAIDQMFEDAQVRHLGIAQDMRNAENRHIRPVGQPSRFHAG